MNGAFDNASLHNSYGMRAYVRNERHSYLQDSSAWVMQCMLLYSDDKAVYSLVACRGCDVPSFLSPHRTLWQKQVTGSRLKVAGLDFNK